MLRYIPPYFNIERPGLWRTASILIICDVRTEQADVLTQGKEHEPKRLAVSLRRTMHGMF